MNVAFWLLVCFAASAKLVEARFRCHNRCSGHGYCSDYDNVCYCKAGYQGVDCSERTCPVETAWADKAYDVDKGHQWVECSNAGRCNRRTGVCECSPGYTGIACEKLKCGGSGDNGCNGHGDCITLGQTYEMIASYRHANETSFYLPSFKDPDQLPAWEATHVTMCSCHPGFSGASCEYRLCPKGDDPMTPHTGYRTISIKLHAFHALAELTGRFLFAFNGESMWFPVGTTLFTAAQCEAAFEALRNIDDVTCTRSTAGDNSVTYTVQLRKFPVMPVETSIYPNDGNPPLSAFVCNLDQVVMYSEENQVFCTVEELNMDKIYPEYAPCSNRGICDFTSGVCFCFQQFSGANCDSYKKAIVPLVEREVSVNEVFTVESTNPDFEATILQFQTFDVASSDFKTINVNNLDRNVFSLDGAGNVDMYYGSLVIGDADNVESSGMTVNTGGLTVTGGVTAYTDTLVINGPTYVTTGGVTVMNGGLRIIGTAEFNGDAEITGGLTVAKGLQLNGGLYIGAGGGTVSLGGLTVNGGLTVASAGLTVNRRGVTILSGGLVVTGGIQLKKVKSGITVDSAVSVLSDGVSIAGGLTVLSGGVVTDSGLSINSGGLVVAELNMQGGGMTVSGGITVDSNGMSVTGGITVMNDGVTVDSTTSTNNVAGGVTVYADGLILPDALTIFSGGVVVTGGVTVPVGDVNIISATAVQVKSAGAMIPLGGLTIYTDGFFITGGVTVVDAGLSVTAGGLSIQGNGLRIYGGLSILSDGGVITGGMTVSTNGVTLNDGVSIENGGFRVYGGMTVQDTGVLLDTGGLSVLSAGLRVSGGTTVNPGGLRVTGGMSVLSHGLRTSAGMTVNSGGFRVVGGLTNTGTSSLVITGGLSVNTPGLYSANAMTVFNTGVKIAAGLSIQADGLEVLDGITLSDSGLLVTADGLSVMSASLWVTGGMTVNDPASGIYVINSMTVAGGGQILGGWTVQNNGLQVSNGGVTIVAGGLMVTTGGLTVQGGLRAHSLTIANTGMNVAAGGLSVSSGGLVVSASGLIINEDGLRASDGLFITGGLELNGGLSMLSGGLSVESGGLTLFNAGASVTGGVSILVGGLTAAGNMVITTGNLIIDDKMEIGANGLSAANGLTLADVGLTTASTLTVTRTGINSADALIAQDNGVRVVSGDVSVLSLGMKVTDGATVSFGGVSFDSSTVAPGTNVIEADGLHVLGAAPVQVLWDGVDVRGDLHANGAVYFGQAYNVNPSDSRLKTQVHRLQGALSKLEQVRGVSYNFKNPAWDLDSGRLSDSSLNSSHADLSDQDFATNTTDRTGKLRFVGLIAQELQAVLPEVVSGIRLGGDDYLGVRYADVVPLVIEAVRELDERSQATAVKWASQQSDRSALSSKQRTSTATAAGATASTTVSEDELIRTYFTFDNSTNQVTGTKPYHGSCNCGGSALNEMLRMLQRIQVLEAEEIRLASQLNAVKAS